MPAYTDAFAQTRTSRGLVPVSSVSPVAQGECVQPLQMEAFRFVPTSPVQAASKNKAQSKANGHALMAAEAAAPTDRKTNEAMLDGEHSRKDMPLLQMATCIKRVEQTLPDGTTMAVNGVSMADVATMAEKAGPLFARAPFARNALDAREPLAADAPLEESRDLWASAVISANLAVTIQEFVSGHIPFAALENKLPFLVKHVVTNPETGKQFSLYFITLGLCPEYAQWLGAPAFIRREVFEGHYSYSFLLQEEGDPSAPVELIVATFDEEITADDYRLLSAACELPVAIDASVHKRLDFQDQEPEEARGLDLSADNLLGEDTVVTEEDLPALRGMVRALIAVHMADARVDLFGANEDTGYLAFNSLLSWMWYDFSCSLDSARIHYCARCGKAFAVVGHRGRDKVFCSIACKDDARNNRVGKRRNEVREQFREKGASVAELARRHFAEEGKQEGERRVRAYLSTWPALKHDIDDDITENGWNCAMLKRCRDEGLDMDKLLSAKRKAELKKLMQAGR